MANADRTTPTSPAALCVELESHVRPLLQALEWMGNASDKLAELNALARCHGGAAGMVGSEYTMAGELMAGVAWVADSLLREYLRQGQARQARQGGAT